jgi:hypothetical protein
MSTIEINPIEKQYLIGQICETVEYIGFIEFLREEPTYELAVETMFGCPEMSILAKLDPKRWRKVQSNVKKDLIEEFDDKN